MGNVGRDDLRERVLVAVLVDVELSEGVRGGLQPGLPVDVLGRLRSIITGLPSLSRGEVPIMSNFPANQSRRLAQGGSMRSGVIWNRSRKSA